MANSEVYVLKSLEPKKYLTLKFEAKCVKCWSHAYRMPKRRLYTGRSSPVNVSS